LKWKIEVSYKPEMPDAAGHGLLQDIADLGITGVESVRTAQIYWIDGDIDAPAIERICCELLADAVTQQYVYGESGSPAQTEEIAGANVWAIEIRFKPGVTDAVGDSVVKGIRDMGISGVHTAQTGQKYLIHGNLHLPTLQTIAQRLLANEVIQAFEIRRDA